MGPDDDIINNWINCRLRIMKEELKEWIIIGIKLISWVYLIISLYMLILILTGHSPTAIELLTGLVISMMAVVVGGGFVIFRKLGKLDGKFDLFTRQFYSMASDFKSFKNEFYDMKTDVHVLKKDMKLVKNKLKIYT